jgi:hypothetical protein
MMAARHRETGRGEESLPSPQALAIGRMAPVRNPSRPASADLVPGTARNRCASAFLRRPRPIKASWMSCLDKQGGRSTATRVDEPAERAQ